MSLTKSEIKQMQDEKACPTCGKRLTAMEIDHLAGGSSKTSESFRPGQTYRVDEEGNLRLSESADHDHEQHEQAVAVFEGLGLSRAGAEAAARGRGGY